MCLCYPRSTLFYSMNILKAFLILCFRSQPLQAADVRPANPSQQSSGWGWWSPFQASPSAKAPGSEPQKRTPPQPKVPGLRRSATAVIAATRARTSLRGPPQPKAPVLAGKAHPKPPHISPYAAKAHIPAKPSGINPYPAKPPGIAPYPAKAPGIAPYPAKPPGIAPFTAAKADAPAQPPGIIPGPKNPPAAAAKADLPAQPSGSSDPAKPPGTDPGPRSPPAAG